MEESQNLYSIKDLENFSGIKAHTIRIWEKRYNLLDPERTGSNIRMYSENELKKILNVAYLNRNGFKISRIATLDDDQLTGKVMDISNRDNDQPGNLQTGRLLMASIKFNEDQMTEAIGQVLKQTDFEEAYIRFLYPLLQKSALLWQTGSISRSQEQFIRNTVKKIIIVEDDKLKSVPFRAPNSVAMLNSSDNLSENNFLFYKYVLRKLGYSVIFTGGILPLSEVLEIHKILPFRFLVVNSGTFDYSHRKIEYLSNIGKQLLLKKIIFTDYPGNIQERVSERIALSGDPEDFLKKVTLLRQDHKG